MLFNQEREEYVSLSFDEFNEEREIVLTIIIDEKGSLQKIKIDDLENITEDIGCLSKTTKQMKSLTYECLILNFDEFQVNTQISFL